MTIFVKQKGERVIVLAKCLVVVLCTTFQGRVRLTLSPGSRTSINELSSSGLMMGLSSRKIQTRCRIIWSKALTNRFLLQTPLILFTVPIISRSLKRNSRQFHAKCLCNHLLSRQATVVLFSLDLHALAIGI